MPTNPLTENVARREVEHGQATGIENSKDVSAYKGSWRRFFWDTWDKPPEVWATDITDMLDEVTSGGHLGTSTSIQGRQHIVNICLS